MPSSSTRSTYSERKLLHLYMFIYSRLTNSRMLAPANFFTEAFAILLETSPPSLRSFTYVPHNYGHLTPKKKAELEFYAKIGSEGDKKPKSDRIWDAGSGCADVGALLIQAGRAAEAREWCMWGDELMEEALNESAREKAEKKRLREEHWDMRIDGQWDQAPQDDQDDAEREEQIFRWAE